MTLDRLRRMVDRIPPRSGRRRLALGWAVLTLVVAAATAPAIGISRDESVYLAAGERYAAWWKEAVARPVQAWSDLDAAYEINHEHPGLAKLVYGTTHALLAPDAAGRHGLTSHLQGFRFGAFLFAALLSALLALAGHELAGIGGGLLAPALFWLVPRHFFHGHPALLDLPVTALWFATVFAYRHWQAAQPGRSARRFGWGLVTGLAFGAAISVKHNAWFLPPLLLVHFVVTHLRRVQRDRLAALAPALPALVVGLGVFVATWPWLWHDTLPRLRDYAQFHLRHENYPWLYLGRMLRDPPFPIAYPFVVTALTVPAAVLAAMVGGLLHAGSRLVEAIRRPGHTEELSGSDELLYLLNGLFSIALIALPQVPHFGGVKHWLPSMPFLAVLGARALVSAGRTLWPERGAAVTAVLALFTLAPGLAAVVHIHPFGTAAYNELAGGAAGAASLGMQRQFWGDNMVAALDTINAHALPGARVWYQEATWLATVAYQRDGRLRPDLRWAERPEEADVSVWHHHAEFMDKEFTTWTQFRTAQPVAGVYLDEVPLIEVYARAGAWR
jgi:4-amino-4-deoxy-L-arabinose transferase-like glycosyltransferase